MARNRKQIREPVYDTDTLALLERTGRTVPRDVQQDPPRKRRRKRELEGITPPAPVPSKETIYDKLRNKLIITDNPYESPPAYYGGEIYPFDQNLPKETRQLIQGELQGVPKGFSTRKLSPKEDARRKYLYRQFKKGRADPQLLDELTALNEIHARQLTPEEFEFLAHQRLAYEQEMETRRKRMELEEAQRRRAVADIAR